MIARSDEGVTMRQVLQLSTLQSGRPIVHTGEVGLDNRVRWVHVSELPDIGTMLRGGELLLTTGIALPATDSGLEHYASGLRSAGVVGLVVELGRRYEFLPRSLIDAMQREEIPLIALQHETPFVRITEEVHELILFQQLGELRLSDQIHRTFTRMSMHGASANEIVKSVAELAGGAVVLENLVHQVLAFETQGEPIASVIGDWERGARRVLNRESTEVITVGPDTWVVADVAAMEEKWGRLVMRLQGTPTHTQIEAIERGANALALNRLVDRTRETLERQAHRTLLNDIRTGAYSSSAVVAMRSQGVGVPLLDRLLVAVVVALSPDEYQETATQSGEEWDLSDMVGQAATSAEIPALVGSLSSDSVGVVLSMSSDAEVESALQIFSKEVHRSLLQRTPQPKARIGVGAVVKDLKSLRRSFTEAEHIVAASGCLPDDRLYFALTDIRLRGLLYLLREDPRLQLFVERELGPLLLHDDSTSSNLEEVLRAFLASGTNKSAAAARLNLSRPSLYYRLQQIETILGVSFDATESTESLHVALLALDVIRSAE